MGDLRAGTPPAVEPERIGPAYEPPHPAGAQPQPTEPARPSANVRKREAQEALTDALGAVVEAMRRAKHAKEPVGPPNLVSLGSLTLVVVAFDLALGLYIVGEVLPPGLGETVTKVLSAVFGIAAVTYIDQVRTTLFRIGQFWRFRLVALAIPLVVLGVYASPYTLQVRSPFPATVTVEGGGTVRRDDAIVIARVRGLHPHALRIEETLMRKDVLEFGPREMFLAALHRFIPPVRWIRGAYVLEAPAADPVIVQVGKDPGELRVRGQFPMLHLKKFRKLGARTTPGPGDTTTVIFDALPNMSQVALRLPPGSYDFTVRGTQCTRGTVAFPVERGKDNDVMLDHKRCNSTR